MNNLSQLIKKLTSFEVSVLNHITSKRYSGKGKLEVSHSGNSIHITGSGKWRSDKDSSKFTFSYRLRLSSSEEIDIEHTRYGESNSVYLCKLIRKGENKFASIEPHTCNEDLYNAELFLNDNSLQLNWKITGPKKDMVLEYTFS